MTPRVVVLAPWVPTADAPHAGGKHVWAHLTEIGQQAEVHLVAPVVDASSPVPGVAVSGVRFRSPNRLVGRTGRYLRWVARGLGPGPQELVALRRFLRSEAGRAVLADADLIEIQYEEMLPLLAEVPPRIPAVVWIHDLVSDELSSLSVHAGTSRRRLESRLRRIGARRTERRWFPRCVGAVVFNPDDVGRLAAYWPITAIRVARPAVLAASELSARSTSRSPAALVVGAFGRVVNRDGLAWLVNDVWPHVRAACPDATLLVVGADAPRIDVAGVKVLGLVDDLNQAYNSADVAAVVGHAGAGMKFTLAQALSHGLPVVATSSAGRGYLPPAGNDFLVLRDAPHEFAAALVAFLEAPDRAQASGRQGRRWWMAASADRATSPELLAWYAEVAAGRGGGPPPGSPANLP